MRLKDYQNSAMEKFLAYWKALGNSRRKAQEIYDWQSSQYPGETPDWTDFAADAWEKYIGKDARYVPRRASNGMPIPHVCIKIPTGGGKTLMGVSVLERTRMQTGLVLWIVPSKAIFEQTWAAFANRAHFYRHALECASGGRVKLLTKGKKFSRSDIENYLCVMPVMLQAAARKNEGKDFYKIFRDTGRYPEFFPKEDDMEANHQLAEAHPDLEVDDLADGEPGRIKHSLYNALKLARPFIVLDEAHNAYTEDRRRQLGEFNPRFILELSATPDPAVSNIVVSVPGLDLKRERMIKLPLNIHNSLNTDWKYALSKAKEKLDELAKEAELLRAETGKYIRPMMLIRVERVGRDQRDGEHIHAEDAREYLINQLGVDERHIRRKTAERDEIAGEDLLSEYCEVRYILTKNALQEGWDCAFAYVLTLLDNTRAARTLTQMTGRVLRQPHAELTGRPPLDESYVFCFNNDVGAAMDSVKGGLEAEGLEDLVDMVRGGGETAGKAADPGAKIYKRRERFADMQIFLPTALCKDGRKYRPLGYERDILSSLDWTSIGNAEIEAGLGTPKGIREITAQVDLLYAKKTSDYGGMESDETVRLEFFVRRLADVIPNPWIAARIVRRFLETARKNGVSESALFAARYNLSESIKLSLEELVCRESEKVFSSKLKTKEIIFDLRAGHDFAVPHEMREHLTAKERMLMYQGDFPEKSLFQKMPERHFNELERNFAMHMDGHAAVKWWHRFVARRSEYSLQGWKRNRVYPDFVVCGGASDKRMFVLETKGMHLVGSGDTEYKRALMKKLEEALPHAMECGSLQLQSGEKLPLLFRIVEADRWRETAADLLS